MKALHGRIIVRRAIVGALTLAAIAPAASQELRPRQVDIEDVLTKPVTDALTV